MNKRKRVIIVASIVILILVVVGTTFAYWTTTRVQSDQDELVSTCLDLDLTNVTNGISLTGAFPIIDAQGLLTTGYTFRLTNRCSSYISYNINMESLTSVLSENRIALDYVDAVIDNNPVNNLGHYASAEQSYLGENDGTAYDTRILDTGMLSPSGTSGATATHILRI